MCTLCVDTGSIGGTVVSASHTLIDIDITPRTLKPAQTHAHHIKTHVLQVSCDYAEQCSMVTSQCEMRSPQGRMRQTQPAQQVQHAKQKREGYCQEPYVRA